jgi:hypothetical protein
VGFTDFSERPDGFRASITIKYTEDLLADPDIFFCDENKDRAHIEQK